MRNPRFIPLPLKTWEVQAILDNRKSRFSRILKFAETNQPPNPEIFNPKNFNQLCPYGESGDILWVRETWCRGFVSEDGETPIPGEQLRYFYRADDDWKCTDWHYPDKEGPQSPPRWSPSIHMPKEACRIFLEVLDVRLERLQDISEEDAIAEGIEVLQDEIRFGRGHLLSATRYRDYSDPHDYTVHPRFSFKSLWQSINGPESWDVNPWLWVVGFKRINKPKNWPAL